VDETKGGQGLGYFAVELWKMASDTMLSFSGPVDKANFVRMGYRRKERRPYVDIIRGSGNEKSMKQVRPRRKRLVL